MSCLCIIHDSPTSDVPIPSLGLDLTEGEENKEEERAGCACIKVSGVHFSQGGGRGGAVHDSIKPSCNSLIFIRFAKTCGMITSLKDKLKQSLYGSVFSKNQDNLRQG